MLNNTNYDVIARTEELKALEVFTPEQISQMVIAEMNMLASQATPVSAPAEVEETKPVVVDPWDTVLSNAEFEVIWDEKKYEVRFDGELFHGYALWLQRANRFKVLAEYKTAKNSKSGVKFEDSKEFYEAKKQFKCITALTVRIWKQAVELQNEKILKEVESNEEWIKEVLKKHNCK